MPVSYVASFLTIVLSCSVNNHFSGSVFRIRSLPLWLTNRGSARRLLQERRQPARCLPFRRAGAKCLWSGSRPRHQVLSANEWSCQYIRATHRTPQRLARRGEASARRQVEGASSSCLRGWDICPHNYPVGPINALDSQRSPAIWREDAELRISSLIGVVSCSESHATQAISSFQGFQTGPRKAPRPQVSALPPPRARS